MITEDQVEQQCLGWFGEDRPADGFGPAIAHNGAMVVSSSRTLANLRDTLLPKVLSGKRRIMDAELQSKDAL